MQDLAYVYSIDHSVDQRSNRIDYRKREQSYATDTLIPTALPRIVH